MFNHPFAIVLVATFVAAVVALVAGIAGLGGKPEAHGARATKLMTLRVGLCFLLLAEILIYVTYLKP